MAFHAPSSLGCALAGLVALSACRMDNPAFGMTDGETGSGGTATTAGSTAVASSNGPGGTSVGSASATGGSATAGSATAGSATAGSATAGSATGGDGPGPSCGDGVITAPEVCDGDNLGGATCESLGSGFHGPGTPACSDDCLTLGPGTCGECGNGLTEDGEDCDPGDSLPTNCEGLGFDGGDLGCSPTCTFDTTNCATCNNGKLEPGEECDMNQFGNGDACSDYLGPGTYDGDPVCDSDCTVNLEGCCLSLGAPCSDDGQCCTQFCSPLTRTCEPPGCGDIGTFCTTGAQCCSGVCQDNKCALP